MKAEQAALALDKASPAGAQRSGPAARRCRPSPPKRPRRLNRPAQADPSNAPYWSNLGNARRELGDVSGAQAAYRRALDADPRYADAANGLGALLVQSGKPAEAVTWFEKALESSPDFHEARLNLGIAYQESGKRAEAAKVYREVLAKAPARFARERKAAALSCCAESNKKGCPSRGTPSKPAIQRLSLRHRQLKADG